MARITPSGVNSAAYMSVRKARVAQFMPRLTDAMPRVAAILPTVTFPGSHAVTSVHLLNAGLTNSTVYPGVITAGPCLAYGAASMNVASNGAVSCATPAISTANPYFEWVTDAPMQELAGAISGNTLFNIECDGDLITPINLYYQAGTYIRIDWGTGNRKFRHYRLYATNGFGLQSISTAATDTIWAPSKAGVRAGFLMDSWGGNFFGIPHTVCKFMGWQYPIVDANGGTGYVAAPSSDNPKFLDRLPGLLAAGIDCLVLMGGINDPQNTAAEQTAVQTLIDTAWATDPTLPIYVFSGWTNSNSSITANAPVNLGIKQAAAARGVPFISTDGWVFGTGDTDTPTGDGNADYFIAAAHPAGDARAYLGARAGLELRARVAA